MAGLSTQNAYRLGNAKPKRGHWAGIGYFGVLGGSTRALIGLIRLPARSVRFCTPHVRMGLPVYKIAQIH